ncbi:MAG: efflux RND transporter periplasmic adaptor subunit [Pseudomonadota bacterium]
MKIVFAILAMPIAFGVTAQSLPVVQIETVQRQQLVSEFVGHGTVHGKQNVTLTAGADGLLTYVAEPGKRVNEGDLIAKVDLLPLQLQQAEQKALLKRAEINLAFQKKELTRLEALAKVDAAAKSAFDETQTQVMLAESDIEIAEIRLRQLQDQIDRAVVKAPFTGVVSQRHVKAGTDVNRAEELVTLLDTEQQEVRLFVPMRYLPFVQVGQTVAVKSGQLALEQFAQASISAIVPMTDTRSQTFELRAQLAPEDLGKWATGQLVDVTLPIVQQEASTLVNRDALILRADGTYLIKVDDASMAEKLKVRVAGGQSQLVAVEVINGGSLIEGDQVAVRGAEGLNTGQKVTIKQEVKEEVTQ